MAFSILMPKVPFRKPPEKHTDHLQRILARGAVISDESAAYRALTRIGYYRLTGYMVPFLVPGRGARAFRPGTTFDQFLDLYELDQKLRVLLLAAIEPIEVALRVAVCNKLAMTSGAHWHTDPAHFDQKAWPALERRIANAVEFDLATGARKFPAKVGVHLFLDHYYDHYGPPAMPPCWMLMEVASFGLVAYIFSSLIDSSKRKLVAQEFHFSDRKPVDDEVLDSWLHGLSVLRNKCAHHSRIVSKTHPFSPKRTTNKTVAKLFRNTNRLRDLLVVLAILSQSVAPKSDWLRRLYLLLDSSSGVDVASAIGFAANWRNDDIWALAW